MGSVIPALKMGNATPYARKKLVACSNNKIVFNKLCERPPQYAPVISEVWTYSKVPALMGN